MGVVGVPAFVARRMEFSKKLTLISLDHETQRRAGTGMAAHGDWVVFSSTSPSAVNVFHTAGSAWVLTAVLGGVPPIQFDFAARWSYMGEEEDAHTCAGMMAFLDAGGGGGDVDDPPHLLVADTGNKCVHVLDIVHSRHQGYIGSRGSIRLPMGVASKRGLVAVSSWTGGMEAHRVIVYERSRSGVWKPFQILGSRAALGPDRLAQPMGLRFNADGTHVVVASFWSGDVNKYRVADGAFVGTVATGLDSPKDVQEWRGGWLVACGRKVLLLRADGGREHVPWNVNKTRKPTALAITSRGIGLAIMTKQRVDVLLSPDAAAMAAMSPARVAWMSVAVRVRRARASPIETPQ